MERKSFLGLAIGAIVGLVLLFLIYFFFFQGTQTGQGIKNTLGNFFPIGGNSDVQYPNGIDDPGYNNDDGLVSGDIVIPKLRRISTQPAAGYIAYDRATSTRTIIGTSSVKIATTTEMVARYMEKSSGQIFETNENTSEVFRISNTTLGLFDQATFSNPTSFVAQRFNSDTSLIDVYVGSLVRIGTTTNEMRTTGAYFPRHPDTLAVRGTSLFALYEYPINSEGFVTLTTPIKEVKVFSSLLSGWNVEWINKDLLLLTTKPNAGYDGYAYTFNPNTKNMVELVGPKAGLTAKVNNNATAGLYSQSDDNGLAVFMANFSKGTYIQLSSPTLPEKCVFSAKNNLIAYCAVPRPLPTGSYPEDWYKGKVQFNDAIVKIDIEKNTETTIINLAQEGGVIIDAINLSLNDKETFLLFENKSDGYVWSYDLR